jgi:hypothetical protein
MDGECLVAVYIDGIGRKGGGGYRREISENGKRCLHNISKTTFIAMLILLYKGFGERRW